MLESKTFEGLLSQAEQFAQDYAVLKEKYALMKKRYRESCTKYEEEIRENAVSSSGPIPV